MLLYFAAGTLGGLIRVGGTKEQTVTQTIVLLDGPIHTDIMVPLTEDVRAVFDFLNTPEFSLDDPLIGWVIFGWGARGFYMQTPTYLELRLRTVLDAATGDTSVMRVEYAPIGLDLSAFAQRDLTAVQFDALLTAIRDTFAETTPLSHAGFSPTDEFFAANGRFHLFQTCNVWVGNMLRQAGVRVGIWTPFNWAFG